MSSPRRVRGHQPVARHSRRDIVIAVSGSAAVVIATALLIWLMRPGPQFSVGTGGLFHRQPRATWLVVLAIAVAGLVVWAVLRPHSRVERRGLVLGAGGAGVLVAAILGGVFWPGGLVHHYPSQPTVPPSTVGPSTVAPTTAAHSSTSVPGTTGAVTSTSVPTVTTAASTTTGG